MSGKSSEKGGSKADTLVKVMLVFFISLLSFSVGTFVGKQVSDSDHRRLALESEFQNREVASAEGEEGGSKVSEKDVENLAEEFVNKEKGEEVATEGEGQKVAEAKEGTSSEGYKSYGHGKEEKAEKREKAPAKKEAPKAHEEPAEKMAAHGKAHDEVAEKVANNKAPSDGEVEARKPSSVLPGVASSAIGKFTVQVASFATEDEAKGQASQLKNKGWAAFYVPASIGGKTWYRVSVGVFNNNNSAQAFRKDFLKESGVKTAIVQK